MEKGNVINRYVSYLMKKFKLNKEINDLLPSYKRNILNSINFGIIYSNISTYNVKITLKDNLISFLRILGKLYKNFSYSYNKDVIIYNISDIKKFIKYCNDNGIVWASIKPLNEEDNIFKRTISERKTYIRFLTHEGYSLWGVYEDFSILQKTNKSPNIIFVNETEFYKFYDDFKMKLCNDFIKLFSNERRE